MVTTDFCMRTTRLGHWLNGTEPKVGSFYCITVQTHLTFIISKQAIRGGYYGAASWTLIPWFNIFEVYRCNTHPTRLCTCHDTTLIKVTWKANFWNSTYILHDLKMFPPTCLNFIKLKQIYLMPQIISQFHKIKYKMNILRDVK